MISANIKTKIAKVLVEKEVPDTVQMEVSLKEAIIILYLCGKCNSNITGDIYRKLGAILNLAAIKDKYGYDFTIDFAKNSDEINRVLDNVIEKIQNINQSK